MCVENVIAILRFQQHPVEIALRTRRDTTLFGTSSACLGTVRGRIWPASSRRATIAATSFGGLKRGIGSGGQLIGCGWILSAAPIRDCARMPASYGMPHALMVAYIRVTVCDARAVVRRAGPRHLIEGGADRPLTGWRLRCRSSARGMMPNASPL